MSPGLDRERMLVIARQAIARALYRHERSKTAAIDIAARVAVSQATIKRSRELLARLREG